MKRGCHAQVLTAQAMECARMGNVFAHLDSPERHVTPRLRVPLTATVVAYASGVNASVISASRVSLVSRRQESRCVHQLAMQMGFARLGGVFANQNIQDMTAV